MKQLLSATVLGAFVLTFTACNSGRSRSTVAAGQKQTQQQDEAAMMMALHHNRDEVFAHMTSLGDFSWQKTPAGMRNWDCSLAIIEKHNQEYPPSVWELEGIELRDRLLGAPTGERKILAEACAERTIQEAQATIALSKAFEK
jgi:hypothetical protein